MSEKRYNLRRTAAVSGGQVWTGWIVNYCDDSGRWHSFALLVDDADSLAVPNRERVLAAIDTYEEWNG